MRLGAGDLLLLLLVGLIGPSVGFGVLSDPGLGWHLRVPDLMFRTTGVPTADPFDGPSHGRPWLANQWLGETPFWLGWELAGWNGVAAVALGLLLLTYRLLFGWLRADGVAWPVALGLCVLAAAAGYVGWLARPTMVTTLFTAVVVRWVVLFHEGRLSAWRLAWVPPLFAVWVNCHGGFVAGLGTLGLAAAVELGVGFVTRDRAAVRRGGVLVVVSMASGLATLLNPYGWRVYPWVFALLGDPFFMNSLNQEWFSPDFHAPGAGRIELLLLLLVGLLAVSRRRPSLLELVLVLFWTHQALQGRRYTPIWVVVVTPLAGRLLADVPATVCRRWMEEWRPMWSLPLAGGWLGPVLMAGGLVGWTAFGPPVRPTTSVIPTAALDGLLARRQPGEAVFHSPNCGGYLILFGSRSGFPVWLDDRNEVHGRERYEEYLTTVATAPGWERRLDEARIVWVVGENGTPLADRLAERPDRWRTEYRDELVSLFRRVQE